MDGTIKKPIKVTKKKRNPRIFRVWESDALNQVLILAMEIKTTLENLADEEDKNINELKPSLLSSESMYALVNSYVCIYDKILKEGLIRTVNPKTHPQVH